MPPLATDDEELRELVSQGAKVPVEKETPMARSSHRNDARLCPHQVHNVVVTTHAQQRIDLAHVATNCADVNYDRTRFAAAIMRRKNPYATALFFNTGKIVCTGGASIEAAFAALDDFVARLRAAGAGCDPTPYRVENIVGASGLCDPTNVVRLDRIVRLDLSVEYEPELFPGLTRRVILPDGTRSTIVVFASGKMILTGNRTLRHLQQVQRFVQGWLPEFVEPGTRKRRRLDPCRSAT